MTSTTRGDAVEEAKSFIRRFGRAVTDPMQKYLSETPWWFRLPAGLLTDLAKPSDSRTRPTSVATALARSLSPDEAQTLRRTRNRMLELLAADRLENGGWGKRNNQALATFFHELPDDFDTEGSITLSRWVVDAAAFSRLSAEDERAFLDDRLVAYLDARFDRKLGASGRLGSPDMIGRRPIQVGARHTAASILCYLSFDLERFLHCGSLQVPYLCNEYAAYLRDSSEVGHPDILRALCLASFHLAEDGSQEKGRVQALIKDGFCFLWDWLNSPSVIPTAFGSSAQMYLRLYSLGSLCDLTVLPGLDSCFLPLGNFRSALASDLREFCASGGASDHRRWGFPVLLLWSYLFAPSAEVDIDDPKGLLLSSVSDGGDFGDGFCVYWAVLLAATDCLIGGREADA